MPTNKSPGMNWLTVEFYRAFWDILGPDLATVWAESLRLTELVLREPELRLVLSAYADDVLLVVQDPGDLARVEACQAIYLAVSSVRVNWVKSSGLVVGDWRQFADGFTLFPTEKDAVPLQSRKSKITGCLEIYYGLHPSLAKVGTTSCSRGQDTCSSTAASDSGSTKGTRSYSEITDSPKYTLPLTHP
ncbi:unnamed protein product [Caretta caretta]